MSLLGPLFLLALPLLAIPIVLHLWRKRRREAVPWGAMQFLVNRDHRQRRFSNIDRWLVLLARCLALLFLIIALARPLVHSERYGSLDSGTDDILVIDHSLSTSRLDDQGQPLIDTIRQRAKDWVNSRPRGATVRILTAAGRPQWLTDAVPTETFSSGPLLDKLDQLRPMAAGSNLAAAIRFAATTQLDRANEHQQPQRRVWVLADAQASDWHLSSEEALAAFCDQMEKESNVEINFGIADAESKIANVALGELSSDGWRKAPGERLRMTVKVVNHDQVRSAPSTVVWTIGDREISRESLIAMAPGETRDLEANVVVRDPGSRVVTCQLQIDDSLSGDNSSQAVVETLDRIPVLLVSMNRPNSRRVDESDFVAAALGDQALGDQTLGQSDPKRRKQNRRSESKRDDTEARRWESIFAVSRCSAAEFHRQPLGDFDAIMLLDSLTLPGDQMQRLSDFVHRGGGLWMFLGDQTELEPFNRQWYAGGLGLSPVALRGLTIVDSGPGDQDGSQSVPSGDLIEEAPDRRLHPPERDHTTLQWLSDATQTDLHEVLINRYYAVHTLDSNSVARVLLRTGAGNPISLLSSHGKGRVIVQTVPMNPSWTNWPLTGSFVVMMDSWLRYISEPRRSEVNLRPGSPLRLRIPLAVSSQIKVRSPSHQETTALPVPRQDIRELRFSDTYESGVYQVRWKKPPRIPASKANTITLDETSSGSGTAPSETRFFSVRRPVEESQLAALPVEVRQKLDSLANASVFDVASGDGTWVRGGGIGNDDSVSQVPKLPIWTPLLYGLLALLLVELCLSGFASIRRFGRRTLGSSTLGSDETLPAASLDGVGLDGVGSEQPSMPQPPEVPVG